jgi:hypothetical protein
MNAAAARGRLDDVRKSATELERLFTGLPAESLGGLYAARAATAIDTAAVELRAAAAKLASLNQAADAMPQAIDQAGRALLYSPDPPRKPRDGLRLSILAVLLTSVVINVLLLVSFVVVAVRLDGAVAGHGRNLDAVESKLTDVNNELRRIRSNVKATDDSSERVRLDKPKKD